MKWVVCAAMALAFEAHAWPNEPSAFLGVPLGAPVANMPACQPRVYSVFCVEAESPYRPGAPRSVHGEPDLGFAYPASLSVVDGNIESVTMSPKQVWWQRLRGLLVERYGQPTTSSVAEVQTLGGARLQSEVLTWVGKSVSVVAVERGSDAVTSTVVAYDNLLRELAEQRKGQKAKSDAKKL